MSEEVTFCKDCLHEQTKKTIWDNSANRVCLKHPYEIFYNNGLYTFNDFYSCRFVRENLEMDSICKKFEPKDEEK